MNKNKVLLAFGQVALIFVGVSVAILFENLNQERKDNKLELLLLSEMLNNVQADTSSIHTALGIMDMQLAAGDRILKILAGPGMHLDSLGFYMEYLTWYNVGIYSAASYETIKSKGLDLIENDSLRQKIVSYYEADLRYIKEVEEVSYNLGYQYFGPRLITNFENSYTDKSKPLNASKLRTDNDYKQYILLSNKLKRFEKERYKEHLTKALAIIDRIQMELERRK